MPFSQEKVLSNNPFANELASQSAQQPELVCAWSAHVLQSRSWSSSPLPRTHPAVTATANAAGESFLVGGHQPRSKDHAYVISTRDFSSAVLRTSGGVQTDLECSQHCSALIGTTFLFHGGTKTVGGNLRLLNLGTSHPLGQVRHQLIIALYSRNATVVPRCYRWSRARQS